MNGILDVYITYHQLELVLKWSRANSFIHLFRTQSPLAYGDCTLVEIPIKLFQQQKRRSRGLLGPKLCIECTSSHIRSLERNVLQRIQNNIYLGYLPLP